MGDNNPKFNLNPDTGMYEGTTPDKIQSGEIPPSGLPIGFYDPGSLQTPIGYGPGNEKGAENITPVPSGKVFSVRIPPAVLNRQTKLNQFTILTTVRIHTPLTQQKILAAIKPLNILPTPTMGSFIVVNIVGFQVYVSQQFPIQPGPQKFVTPVGWRQPQPVLIAILTMENQVGASCDPDFGFFIATGPQGG